MQVHHSISLSFRGEEGEGKMGGKAVLRPCLALFLRGLWTAPRVGPALAA